MSEIKVNKISPRTACGTTTLGDSGDTFTIPAGVTITNNGTQTGFGRTGAVDWQTSIKTTSFTAVSGEGYFINTTSGAVTMTLPASPSVGDIVSFKDYAGTFDTNNLTINRNGSNIVGGTNNPVISVEGQAGTLVYGDATQGWQIVEAATDADLPRPAFVAATGGTITTVCTNFKVHTFTGPGTFTVTCAGNPSGSTTVDYLVVAGGGGGGKNHGGGGGAGGYRESPGSASGCYSVSPRGVSPAVALPVSVQGYPIAVGGGGAGATSPNVGTNGVNSSFSTITSAGGGAGAGTNQTATAGGSGGGGAGEGSPRGSGNGNTPAVTPVQGTNGGNGQSATPSGGAGGGGGAICAGTAASSNDGAPGGNGATSSINGTPTARAGGGGGGVGSGTGAPGGTGGGGTGGCGSSGTLATNGTDNTGGGGGGGQGGPASNRCGGTGGSGIVIIRYKFQ